LSKGICGLFWVSLWKIGLVLTPALTALGVFLAVFFRLARGVRQPEKLKVESAELTWTVDLGARLCSPPGCDLTLI
jgi:hypothetical protein